MSGRLQLVDSANPRSKHEHVVLQLGKDRQLRLHDTRKFARLYLLADPAIILDRLGPEPLAPSFTARALGNILHSRRRRLKPLLLDQNILAGLGNIYTDEALWEARIHPCRQASSLSDLEIKALHRAIRKVLRQGLQNSGTTLGNGKGNFRSVAEKRGQNQALLNIFHRTNLPCPRCKTPVERLVVAQRSTHICPTCQN
jgi:formamidopyrimidine-DNA glycosylase